MGKAPSSARRTRTFLDTDVPKCHPDEQRVFENRSWRLYPTYSSHCIDTIPDRSLELEWRSMFLNHFPWPPDCSGHWARRIGRLSPRYRAARDCLSLDKAIRCLHVDRRSLQDRVQSQWTGAWGLKVNRYPPVNQLSMTNDVTRMYNRERDEQDMYKIWQSHHRTSRKQLILFIQSLIHR